jgi:hypothetical protein
MKAQAAGMHWKAQWKTPAQKGIMWLKANPRTIIVNANPLHVVMRRGATVNYASEPKGVI